MSLRLRPLSGSAPTTLVALALAACAAPAWAEDTAAGSLEPAASLSASAALPLNLLHPRAERLPVDGAESLSPADGARAPIALRSSALSAARLVELPAEVVPGRYSRPKYALGFRSSAMKSFANRLGLEADTCLLPLIRARTTISQDGEVGGRVMLFARCSFY